MLPNACFYNIMDLENGNFSFSHFLFSQLWTTLPRKLMKKLAIFIKHFQTRFQIVHFYQVLQSEYFFFQKFRDPLNVLQDLHKDAYSVAVFQKCKKYLTCALTEMQTFG